MEPDGEELNDSVAFPEEQGRAVVIGDVDRDGATKIVRIDDTGEDGEAFSRPR